MHEIVIATVCPGHRHRRPIPPAFGTDHAPLVLYPVFYGWLAASSSLFLFFFYQRDCRPVSVVWRPVNQQPLHRLDAVVALALGDFADRTDRFWRRGMAMNSTVQSGESQSFLLPLVIASVALWWEPRLKFPAVFTKNVLSYSGFWGLSGNHLLASINRAAEFNVVNFFHLPLLERVVRCCER